ncbi:TRA2B [Cordylochernes scorpioides]|uniref:TRA2B n=1 Tax=Cordylochernes scorpioides TaxID=51811 RepID=A0ABY6K5G2_9ARAC|nr:TRA2B [Cordylochernes scorpioides]
MFPKSKLQAKTTLQAPRATKRRFTVPPLLRRIHSRDRRHTQTGRLFRWSLRLSTYNYEIHYLKGSQQYEADLLSRNPFVGFISADIIKQHQPTASPFNIDTNGLHTITRKGVIKIIIPETLQHTLMNKVHQEYNHPGISQMTRIITTHYYWKGISKSIENLSSRVTPAKSLKGPKISEVSVAFGETLRYCSWSSSVLSESPRLQKKIMECRRYQQRDAEPNRCIGVFGLSCKTDESRLKDFFSRYGELEKVELARDSNRDSRCFGFCYFIDLDSATLAVQEAYGKVLDGREIRVDFSFHKRDSGQYYGRWNSRPNGRSDYRSRERRYVNDEDFSRRERRHREDSSPRRSRHSEDSPPRRHHETDSYLRSSRRVFKESAMFDLEEFRHSKKHYRREVYRPYS